MEGKERREYRFAEEMGRFSLLGGSPWARARSSAISFPFLPFDQGLFGRRSVMTSRCSSGKFCAASESWCVDPRSFVPKGLYGSEVPFGLNDSSRMRAARFLPRSCLGEYRARGVDFSRGTVRGPSAGAERVDHGSGALRARP